MSLIGKYVTSPIDGIEYCRKNGQFMRHLKANGFQTYQDFYDYYYPNDIQMCGCGIKCTFNKHKMEYRRSCGTKECVSKISSSVKQNFSDEQKQQQYKRYKKSMLLKSDAELVALSERRVATGVERNSFKLSVPKREQTCVARYGDTKYNNAQQISSTKLNWSESRKQLFRSRLSESLGGKCLNDFHTDEMFIARRKMLEERGDVTPLDQLSEWKRYSIAVRNLTEKNYRTHKDVINPHNVQRAYDQHELDHIIPVKYGFMNDISIEMMASVDNLQMLTMVANRRKGSKYEPSE